jgi:GAF domain-containing protein
MEIEFLVELQDNLRLDRVAGHGAGTRLVNACVAAVGVTGAGIMLMRDSEHRGTLGTSDAAIAVVEELQFTLGEGPCIDTYRSREPVLEPHLREPLEHRWHAFSGPAVAAGVEAIFGFPLTVGDHQLGALDLYMDEPTDLTPEQFADALTMADVVAHAILDLQAAAPPGALATELESDSTLRSVVHQASGMVSVQLDMPVDDALARMRAYAYAEGRPINDIAQDIVNRELRLA